MASPLDSTYGVWLVALFLETFLYGIGVLQTWIYFAGRPTDRASIKITVSSILLYYFLPQTEYLQVFVVLCVTTRNPDLQPLTHTSQNFGDDPSYLFLPLVVFPFRRALRAAAARLDLVRLLTPSLFLF